MADMFGPRCSHGVCQSGKFIYVCGGRSDKGLILKSFERYDVSMNLWEPLIDAPVAAIKPLLVQMNDRFIFKFGGITAEDSPSSAIERYDIMNNKWETIAYTFREDARGFTFYPSMTGTQISYNSIIVILL